MAKSRIHTKSVPLSKKNGANNIHTARSLRGLEKSTQEEGLA